MRATGKLLGDVARSMFARPDEVMLEVGASGELLVARLRVIVSALLLLLPLANGLTGGTVNETLIGVAGAIAVNVFAQLWLALARRKRRYPWLPFASAAHDVSATTLVLALLAANHLPAGVNSLVVWCCYPLAIVVSTLRNDGRVALFVGALALLQYGLLTLAVFSLAHSPEQLISTDYGTVTLANQLQRMVLLVIFTIVTAVIVFRMQRLVELSGSDGLTGLPNRTWLVHRFPRLLDGAQRDGVSLCLALIDLDYFKRVNDELGHQAGDRAINHVVAVVQDSIEPGEWLVRLGGQEFVLVMRKPLGTAWERVDALRRALIARRFVHEGAEPMLLTFSAGLASYPHEAGDLSGLLRRADQRLHTAKQHGRNRVLARDA